MSTSGPPVVYVQLGAPFGVLGEIQQTLWAYRRELLDTGVMYARDYPFEDVDASLSLRRVTAALRSSPGIAGVWDRVSERARSWPGRSIISHGTLGQASSNDVQHALESLQPAEIHVVFTARDLLTHAYAHWSQRLSNGGHQTFADFAADLAHGTVGDEADPFWASQDPINVLARWSIASTPERAHLLVAPPGKSPWPAYCGLIGIDPGQFPARAECAVAWPSASDAELLRLVNVALAGRLDHASQNRLVKGMLRQELLPNDFVDPQIPAVPRDVYDWFVTRIDETVEVLKTSGYDIIGDIRDLRETPLLRSHEEPSGLQDDLLSRLLQVSADVVERMRGTRDHVEAVELALASLRDTPVNAS